MPKRTPANPETKINITGNGEDQVVRDLLSKDFAKASNLDAVEIALALQAIIRGQDSLLEQVKQSGEIGRKAAEEIAHIKEHMALVDQTLESYQNDQQKFIQDTLDRAEKLRKSGDDKDKIIAGAAIDYQNEIKMAGAKNASDLMKFHEEIEKGPKEIVVSSGKFEMATVNGHLEAKLFNEEVRIKDRVWILIPGVPTEVPVFVADALRQRRKQEMETKEREATLSGMNNSAQKVAELNNKISQKYNSSADFHAAPELY
jgi:hypothetical protein